MRFATLYISRLSDAEMSKVKETLEKVIEDIRKRAQLFIKLFSFESCSFMFSDMHGSAPVATGEFKRSISSDIVYGYPVTQVTVGPKIFYAPFVEFGVHTGRFRPPIAENTRFVQWVKLKGIVIGRTRDPVRVAFRLRKALNRKAKMHRLGTGTYSVLPKFVAKKTLIKYVDRIPRIASKSFREAFRHAL